MAAQGKYTVWLSPGSVNDVLKALGVKEARLASSTLSKLRGVLKKRNWSLHCKWDKDLWGSSSSREKWDDLRQLNISKSKIKTRDLELLKSLAPFVCAESIFPVHDEGGLRTWYTVDGETLKVEEDHWSNGVPELTPGSKVAIVDAILDQPRKNLAIFLGIHRYLDAAIEVKLKEE